MPPTDQKLRSFEAPKARVEPCGKDLLQEGEFRPSQRVKNVNQADVVSAQLLPLVWPGLGPGLPPDNGHDVRKARGKRRLREHGEPTPPRDLKDLALEEFVDQPLFWPRHGLSEPQPEPHAPQCPAAYDGT